MMAPVNGGGTASLYEANNSGNIPGFSPFGVIFADDNPSIVLEAPITPIKRYGITRHTKIGNSRYPIAFDSNLSLKNCI